jgi:hypothetical protein
MRDDHAPIIAFEKASSQLSECLCHLRGLYVFSKTVIGIGHYARIEGILHDRVLRLAE